MTLFSVKCAGTLVSCDVITVIIIIVTIFQWLGSVMVRASYSLAYFENIRAGN